MRKISISLIFILFLCFTMFGCSSSSDNDPPIPVLQSGDTVRLTLIQTTDVHHHASGTGSSAAYSPGDETDSSGGDDPTLGGYARLSTQIERIRLDRETADVPVLLVDSGDFLMGTVYDLTAADPAALKFMEFMKYDAITLGNHEFDYGPEALARFISNAKGPDGSGFNVPIVATNTVTDATPGTGDDGIEAFEADGTIQKTMLLTLPNGLKVGVIGLMGDNADEYSPQAPPVMFEHSAEFIQNQVNQLRDEGGAHLIIALSHSGIRNPNGTPFGEDIELARNVTGIDIIASGHEHEQTDASIQVGDTHIFCAGRYGENLAVLDVTFTVDNGVDESLLTNIRIDDSIPGDPSMNSVVEAYDADINEALAQMMPGLTVNGVIAGSDSDNLAKPWQSAESGMGNLVADAYRHALMGFVQAGMITEPSVGVVANGTVRSGFATGQEISFADAYAVLPLGMTLDPSQQNLPGYPLLQIWITGAEIRNLCQLTTYVMASEDAEFIAALPDTRAYYTAAASDASQVAEGLSAGYPVDAQTYDGVVLPLAESGDETASLAVGAYTQAGGETAGYVAAAAVYAALAEQASQAVTLCGGLQMALPLLAPDYYLNLSGVQFAHGGAAGLYQVAWVSMYDNNDAQCQYPPSPLQDDALYPCVVDLYTLVMVQSSSLQYLLDAFSIPIVPKYDNEDPSHVITMVNLLDNRLDAEPDITGGTPGIQEVKSWQAFLKYMTAPATDGGLANMIPDAAYGTVAIETGDSSRVNP